MNKPDPESIGNRMDFLIGVPPEKVNKRLSRKKLKRYANAKKRKDKGSGEEME